MNEKELELVAKKLLEKSKGILAADESNGTADIRLAEFGVPSSPENRRKFRDLLLCTPDIEKYITGVILYDETFWQKSNTGETFPNFLVKKGVLPGIKVDLGAKDFPGFRDEYLTVGLDDLPERCKKYVENGAKFAKWRAVIKIDEAKNLPTDEAIEANADALGRYARICQEAGLVPIVEPEVLLNGPHSIETSERITTMVIRKVFEKLGEYRAHIPAVILKTSMAINGDQNPEEASPQQIADATVRMLVNNVPENIGGVVFLSGGQTEVEATTHFDAIAEKEPLPFEIAFSYSRALQNSALRIWQGKDENLESARQEFTKRLRLNKLADAGDYDITMEYLE